MNGRQTALAIASALPVIAVVPVSDTAGAISFAPTGADDDRDDD